MCSQILEVCEEQHFNPETFGPKMPQWQGQYMPLQAMEASDPGSSPALPFSYAMTAASPAEALSYPLQDGTTPQLEWHSTDTVQQYPDAENGWQEHGHVGLDLVQVQHDAGFIQPTITPASAGAEPQSHPASLPGHGN